MANQFNSPHVKEKLKKDFIKLCQIIFKDEMVKYSFDLDKANRELTECRLSNQILLGQIHQMKDEINELKKEIWELKTLPDYIRDRVLLKEIEHAGAQLSMAEDGALYNFSPVGSHNASTVLQSEMPPASISQDTLNQEQALKRCPSRKGRNQIKKQRVNLPTLFPKKEPEDGAVELPLVMDLAGQSTSGTNGQDAQTFDSSGYYQASNFMTQVSYEQNNLSANYLQNEQLYSEFDQPASNPNFDQFYQLNPYQFGTVSNQMTQLESPFLFNSNQIIPGQVFYSYLDPPPTPTAIQVIRVIQPRPTISQPRMALVDADAHAHGLINQADYSPLPYSADSFQQ